MDPSGADFHSDIENGFNGAFRSRGFDKYLLVFSGFVIGIVTKLYLDVSEDVISFIDLFGETQIRMLKMIMVPLIVSSVTVGAASLRANITRKMVTPAAAYFFCTTVLSITTGIILALVIKPGVEITADKNETEEEFIFFHTASFIDFLRNMVPENWMQAFFQQYKTEIQENEIHSDEPNSTWEMDATEVEMELTFIDKINPMFLIVCSLLVELLLTRLGEQGRESKELLRLAYKVMPHLVPITICYLPVGLFFMIISHMLEVQDWQDIFRMMKLVLVVVLGHLIHGFVVLPLIYLLLTRSNPWTVIRGVSPALLAAFIFSSSSAALPLTLRCCEERILINHEVSRFTLPIGARVNMGGTALYEVAAAVFVAQLYNINLRFSQIVQLGILVAFTSTGPAGIPATGAVPTLFVLTAMSLPAKKAAVLVVVEWLLDHCNTFVNVLGDCIGAALLNHLYVKELMESVKEDQCRTRESDSVVTGSVSDEELSFKTL